jgi:ferrous iron transport protein B
MHCEPTANVENLSGTGSIALVGHPNVGKSALFLQLTGQRVIVSNYPGTTVEVTRGSARALPGVPLVDTPGVITLPANSEDEKVTERVLLLEPLQAILQVGDAKNLRRTLLLSCQLAEMGVPLVLALNMTDEARLRGIQLDHASLAEALGIQIVPTAAIHRQGVDEVTLALQQACTTQFQIAYAPEIEQVIERFSARLEECVSQRPLISPRSLALLWLGDDPVIKEWLDTQLDEKSLLELSDLRVALQSTLGETPVRRIQSTRFAWIERVANTAILESGARPAGLTARISQLTTHPIWGWFVLAGVLYALYWFVGVLGAGVMVNYLEKYLFGQVINPAITQFVYRLIPIAWLAELIVGPYGLWTMGVTYALALILPIVTTFFLAFGVMEDSGYLPRLAALSNRMFKTLGLNGKAVLPMVLGLGCVTMATITTRVLETKRERLLATFLLALAIPCSAQLGVVMGMLAGVSFSASLIWSGVVLAVMLAVGWLAARLVPGERTLLLVELPPLRLPQASNVVLKTLARLEWYAKEVLPLFLIGSLLMFTLDKTGALAWLIKAGEPLVTGWLGLPPAASAAFLMGFLRRDFGVTGLFDMRIHGLLSPLQTIVSMVTVTLFIPCLASVMMIAKERNLRTALGMLVIITPFAMLVGGLLYRLLLAAGWS